MTRETAGVKALAYIKQVLARDAYFLDATATDGGWMVRAVVVEKKSKGTAGGKAWHALYEVRLDEHCEPQYHVRRGFWDKAIPEPHSPPEITAEKGGEAVPANDEAIAAEDETREAVPTTEEHDPAEELESPVETVDEDLAVETDEDIFADAPEDDVATGDQPDLTGAPDVPDEAESPAPALEPVVAPGPPRPKLQETQGPPQVVFRYVRDEAVSDDITDGDAEADDTTD